MGLDTTATHFIWFFAGVAVLGLGVQGMDLVHDLAEAREAADRLDQARLSTRLGASTFCYVGAAGGIIVNATNAGGTLLSVSGLTFVVDGAAYVGNASSWLSSDLWAPGEHVEILLPDATSEPSRLSFTTAEGVAIYPMKIDCPRLSRIAVEPVSPSLLVGSTQTFTAVGYDQYDVEIPDLAFTWSTTAGAITTLDADSARLDAGTTSGTFSVTATSGSVSGSATVVLTPDAPVSLTLTPPSATVPAGGAVQFTAQLLDQYGNENTTATVAWSTDAGAVSASGLLTAQTTTATGRIVTATHGALSDSSTVDVVAGPVASVTVAPSSATLLAGATQAFTATAYDAYGNENTTEPISWSATRGAITADGLYTAPSTRGADVVTATAGGVSGSADVTVTQTVHVASLGTFSGGVADAAFLRGETVEVRATVRDHNGNLVEGVTVSVQFLRPNGQLVTTASDATDAAGLASVTYVLPGNAQPGQWTARVSAVTGADVTYDSAANVVTAVTFDVS